jgi:predicted nucleic acid-binding protein
MDHMLRSAHEQNDSDPQLAAVWRMRNNRSAYDAAYVALAESLDASLITLDSRMAFTPSPVAIEVY